MKKEKMQIANITFHITRKNIKNIYLRIDIAKSQPTISAPLKIDAKIIERFARSKLKWVKKQLSITQSNTPKYTTGEKHLFFGKAYLLKTIESSFADTIWIKKDTIEIHTKNNLNPKLCQSLIDKWYISQLSKHISFLVEYYQPRLDVKIQGFKIKKMTSQWGSCSMRTKKLNFNIELAKYPPKCLEYVVVHEMAHLLEANHQKAFYDLLDKHMQGWKLWRSLLKNKAPY